jgi:hypothetical protein
MNIIRPSTITADKLHSSTVPETDYAEYAAGTTYADGDKVIVAASHKIYESLQNGNVGHAVTDTAWWLDCGYTNRWKSFDQKVTSQSSQASEMTWVFELGTYVDSLSMHNLDASEAQIIVADQAEDLITNGDNWTGATGTTPPDSWDAVNAPSDFLIDSGALKITANGANGGTSQTLAVTPETEYQFLGIYRNTSGDSARIAVYDESNGADITAMTDLASSTVDRTLSHVFTTPAGCTSVTVKLLAKSPGDIVWFSRVSLAPTLYNETISLLNTVAVVDWYTYFYEPIVMATDLVKTDLATVEVPPISTTSITMIVTNTGGTAKVGEIIMGLKFNIGKMKYRPSVSINNFSGKTIDPFGDTTITPRGWSKKLNCELILKNTVVDEVYRQYTLYKDTAIVWVGDPDHSILVVYGLWKNFEIVLPYPDYSVCNLQIEGLT